MFNFLPQINKKEVISEYLMRFFSLLLLFVFLSILVLISFFSPAFFLAKYKGDVISSQLATVKQQNVDKTTDPILFIKNVNRLLVSMSDSGNSNISDAYIINKIIKLKNKDIKVLSLDIKTDSNYNRTIVLGGVANTRDSLTLFEKDIKTDGFFDSVIFPVSNFIKSSDSQFSVTLTYKNK